MMSRNPLSRFVPLALSPMLLALHALPAMAGDFASFRLPEVRADADDMSDAHGAAAVGYQTLFGGEARSTGSATQRLVLGVQFKGFAESGEPAESYRLFMVEGQVSAGKDAQGKGEIPAYQLKIVPFSYYFDAARGDYPYEPQVQQQDQDPTVAYLGYELVELTAEKDAVIGNRQAKIKLFALKTDLKAPIGNGTKVLVDVSLSALGYSRFKDFLTQNSRDAAYFVGLSMTFGVEKILLNNRLALRWNVFHGDVELLSNGNRLDARTEAQLVFKRSGYEIAPFINLSYRVWTEYGTKEDRDYSSVNLGISGRF